MYAPFNVPKLIGRTLEVSLTKESGIAGLTFVARQHLRREFRKEDPKIRAAREWMLRQFDEGRQAARPPLSGKKLPFCWKVSVLSPK
jgi:2-phosphinomethylmalic acid synthase